MMKTKKTIFSIVLTVIVLALVSCIDKSLCYFHFESIPHPNQWTETDSLCFNFSLSEQQVLASNLQEPLKWTVEANTSTDFIFNSIKVEMTRVGDSICLQDTIKMHIITNKQGAPILHWGAQSYTSDGNNLPKWKSDTIRRVIIRPIIPDSITYGNNYYSGITNIGLSVQHLSSRR